MDYALRSTQERIASLDVFLVGALRDSDEMMEMLDAMIDDPDQNVRKKARQVLITCAPIFPSALEETLYRLLRSEEKHIRNDAFNALIEASKQWPEVGVLHLDDLIREENARPSTKGCKSTQNNCTKSRSSRMGFNWLDIWMMKIQK